MTFDKTVLSTKDGQSTSTKRSLNLGVNPSGCTSVDLAFTANWHEFFGKPEMCLQGTVEIQYSKVSENGITENLALLNADIHDIIIEWLHRKNIGASLYDFL